MYTVAQNVHARKLLFGSEVRGQHEQRIVRNDMFRFSPRERELLFETTANGKVCLCVCVCVCVCVCITGKRKIERHTLCNIFSAFI